MAIPDTITADMLKRMADEIDQKPMFTDLLISRGWRDQLVRVSTPPQKPEIDNPIYAGICATTGVRLWRGHLMGARGQLPSCGRTRKHRLEGRDVGCTPARRRHGRVR